ncbi:MAG: PHP-associated domain-containing protein [Clostridiales bacterium]|nr:PHP-associated domain-containing protein [Clostridiales bacterium]
MLKAFRADLHIHTCLSPCGELEMSPLSIARTASEKSIDILGVCDHNSVENVPALREAAKPFKIDVLAGIEVASEEEVHVLGLFDSLEAAFELQAVVYDHLPGENDEEAFGLQVVVNSEGEVLRINKKLLIGASTLTLERVVELIHSLDGLAIASHIDREGFSLIGQLGFVPENISIDALEVSPRTPFEEAQRKFNFGFPLTASSDAHRLEEIGQATTSFLLQAGTVAEIKLALQKERGRKILN